MKRPILLGPLALSLALTSALAPATAKNVVFHHTWTDHDSSDPGLAAAEVIASGQGWDALRIVVEPGAEPLLPVARFPGVVIVESQYALSGEVRYRDVGGTGYLEMWSIFPNGARFFTRTLAPTGPLQSLQGSAEWRPFTLPFYLADSPLRPEAIELNVVLPEGGTVELGPLSLVEFAPGEDPIADATGSWWSDRTAALVGGIGGATLGMLGALIGILAGLGRARALVTMLVVAISAIGVASLAAGAVAFFGGQPYGVYYPLALGGILATGLGLTALVVLPRRYAAIELRRMDALDAS